MVGVVSVVFVLGPPVLGQEMVLSKGLQKQLQQLFVVQMPTMQEIFG